MDDVERVYNEGKLLARAMDGVYISNGNDGKIYECQTWGNEFASLMNNGMDSLSTTLIIPNVGVRTYKNIGFLINSDYANCFHISKSDSLSSGNTIDGDFSANKSSFDTVSELAQYISANNYTTMNEVNVNAKIDSVLGLFINKCRNINHLIKEVYVIKYMLKEMTGIDYPIYVYDFVNGKLEKLDLSLEQEDSIINSLECDKVTCWPDSVDEPFIIPIESNNFHK